MPKTNLARLSGQICFGVDSNRPDIQLGGIGGGKNPRFLNNWAFSFRVLD
ncbi:hypothetical protein PL10110_200014 [Planktothrix agardhii]|nr:hypothetical protein PL10110_200014 [Planktothrix agardhii]